MKTEIQSKEFKFDAKDDNIEGILFKEGITFKIPRYQRQYSWTDDNILDFWNDLKDITGSYFIGSFVLNYENERERVIEVIDGQQRIIAITIFMAVLRDLLNDLGSKDEANWIQGKRLASQYTIDGYIGSKIECGDQIQGYFKDYILNPETDISNSKPQNKEEAGIKKHYELFRKLVKDEEVMKNGTPYEKKEYLKDLSKKVDKIKAIKIKIFNDDDAYVLFETINARGVELSVADLLKNLIFKEIRPDKDKDKKEDIAKERWAEIVGNIKGTNVDLQKFFRYYWLSKYSFVPTKRLYRRIKEEIDNYDDFLEDMVIESNAFNKFFDVKLHDWVDRKGGKTIFKSLQAINIMNITQCYVFFMSLFRNEERIRTSVSNIVEFIEKFAFRYFAICNLPANKVERMFSKFAIKLEKIAREDKEKHRSGNAQSLFERMKKELKDLNPSTEEFKENFLDLEYKQSQKSQNFIKYILRELNRKQTTQEMEIDFSEVTAEHIIPRNPGKGWNVTKEEIKDYVEKLGNITLIGEGFNKRMGNKSLKEKIKFLRKSEIKLTEDLANHIQENEYRWGEKEVIKRQQDLADIANNVVWNLDLIK